MKKSASYITTGVFLIFFGCLQAQVTFRTIVTQGPVVEGESFQVQYVIEGLEKEDEFFPPDFRDFHFVSGPNSYTGSALGANGAKKLKNIVYTLVALRPGKFIVPGASARVGDKLVKSENLWLKVISKAEFLKRGRSREQESNEDYFLGPGEDPYAKMQRNLFMKVMVDKKACFVGEPVTATFKLYSRLESRSDIVKNPGFYGFTVQDMISLDDRVTVTEKVNGKDFDVHVVRKVQLYPLQAGLFHIDEMEVRNKVEFSKSLVSKKTEQEIDEGVYTDNDATERSNTLVFENNMHTEPVAISVKAVPGKNRPANYAGATGDFKIAASLEKNELSRNEEGLLLVTISGKGNFTQLAPPVITWPGGIEGFEPTVMDSLDHDHSPLKGKRVFRFKFVSAKAGSYVLPSLNFSFFKPDSNNYNSISTGQLMVGISRLEKKNNEVVEGDSGTAGKRSRGFWWLAALAGALIIAGVSYRLLRKEKMTGKETANPSLAISVPGILQPAYTFAEADDKTFYNVLRKCIWEFFNQHLGLTGSKMNKALLQDAMNKQKVDDAAKTQVMEILQHCETGMFTAVEDTADKKKLLEETKDVLKRINEQLTNSH